MSAVADPGPAPVEGTRELIARHARRLFEERGYTGTSVRAIATAAGVDPALVIRHFGSKEELFVHVVGLDRQPGPELEGPVETLGVRLAAFVLGPERALLRRIYSVLIRASDYESVRAILRETTSRLFIEQLAARLPGPDAELRALLISAQLGGIIQAWSVLEDEHLSGADTGRVVELYGGAIQRLIDEPA